MEKKNIPPVEDKQESLASSDILSSSHHSLWVWVVGLVIVLLLGGIGVLAYLLVSLKKEVVEVKNDNSQSVVEDVDDGTNFNANTSSAENTNANSDQNTEQAKQGVTKTRVFAGAWGGGKSLAHSLEIYRIDSTAKAVQQIFNSSDSNVTDFENPEVSIFGITDTGQVVYLVRNNKEGADARGYIKIYTPSTQKSENLVQSGDGRLMGGIVSPDGKYFVYNSAGVGEGSVNFIYRYDLVKREQIQIFEEKTDNFFYQPTVWLDNEWFLSMYTSQGSDAPAYRKTHTIINAKTASTKEITFEGNFDSKPSPTYDHKAFTYTTFDYDTATKKSVARIKTVDLNGVTKTVFESSKFEYGNIFWIDTDTLAAFVRSTDKIQENPFSSAGYSADGVSSLSLIHVQTQKEEQLPPLQPRELSALAGDVLFYLSDRSPEDDTTVLRSYEIGTKVDRSLLEANSYITLYQPKTL